MTDIFNIPRMEANCKFAHCLVTCSILVSRTGKSCWSDQIVKNFIGSKLTIVFIKEGKLNPKH